MSEKNVAADELRLLIERAERLEEEKKSIADDIKDVFAEAKSRGYDAAAIRKIIAIRKKNREEFQEEEAVLETYMHALGMVWWPPCPPVARHGLAPNSPLSGASTRPAGPRPSAACCRAARSAPFTMPRACRRSGASARAAAARRCSGEARRPHRPGAAGDRRRAVRRRVDPREHVGEPAMMKAHIVSRYGVRRPRA